MFGYRRPARLSDGTALPSPMPDLVVCEAEQIVCQAWESVLMDRGGRMESMVQAARANCHTASRLMGEAQRGGDPDELSTAGANLREALDVTHRSALAAQRVRDALSAELDLLTRALEQRWHAGLADQTGLAGPVASAGPGEPLCALARDPRFRTAPHRRAQDPARLLRLFGRLIRACARGRRRP
jgi:hypothetical protein